MTGRPSSVEIYALLDPDTGAVRYIGKAVDARKRLAGHMRECRRKSPLYSWLGKLRAVGKVPALSVIETCEDADWRERERFHIAAARASGAVLNLADGGDQPLCSKATLAANGRRNAQSRDKRIWALKRSIGQGLKNGWVNEVTKEKLRYAARKRPELFGEWASV